MPSRRAGGARTVLWGLLGVAVLCGGGLLALYRLPQGGDGLVAKVVHLTRVALVEIGAPPPAESQPAMATIAPAARNQTTAETAPPADAATASRAEAAQSAKAATAPADRPAAMPAAAPATAAGTGRGNAAAPAKVAAGPANDPVAIAPAALAAPAKAARGPADQPAATSTAPVAAAAAAARRDAAVPPRVAMVPADRPAAAQADAAPPSRVAAGAAPAIARSDVPAAPARMPAQAASGAWVARTAPAVPANRRDADTATASPSFDIVRVAPGGSTVVAGRAAPDAQVALLDNGHEIGRAKADESGQFVVIPDQPLPAGGQILALREDRPGAAPITGTTPALVVVPAVRHGAEAGHAAHDAAADAPVAVLAPPDAAPRLLSVPSDAGGPAGQVALRVVDYDAKGKIRFAGTARPGTIVRLYIDDRPVGESRTDAQGRWALAPDAQVDAGAHRLRADDLGAGGKVLSRAELPFQRAAFAADVAGGGAGTGIVAAAGDGAGAVAAHARGAAPRGERVVVQPRQSLWRIARHIYGHGMRYTEIFAANRNQIRDPNRIYPGQVFALPADGTTPAH